MNLKKIICFFSLFFALAGCSSPAGYWYKVGGSQNDYDIDSKDCELIAIPLSMQYSETGKQIEAASYNQIYTQCISTKGWSRNPSASSTNSTTPPPQQQDLSIEVTAHSLTAFEQVVTMPNMFNLKNKKQLQIGPTVMEQFTWQNEKNTFINVIFQQNNTTFFEEEDYPVSAPFFLYDAGTGKKGNEQLNWASFFGKIQNEWVMGVGGYYNSNKTKRIIVVITEPLAAPIGKAPPRVRLSKNQYQQIDIFANKWTAWLETNFSTSKRTKAKTPKP